MSYDIIPHVTLEFNIHTYKITDLEFLVNAYKTSCSKFFAYLKIMRPDPNLKTFGSSINTYQNNWVVLASDILKHYNHNCSGVNSKNHLIKNKMHITYNMILELLNLDKFEFQNIDGYKAVWGPAYWQFLHLTSILCVTTYQKDLFSSNMLNFNLAMICGECSNNFKRKNPFALMVAMSISSDTITPIFELHNTVNLALKKPVYSFDDFVARFKIKPTFKELIKLNLIS